MTPEKILELLPKMVEETKGFGVKTHVCTICVLKQNNTFREACANALAGKVVAKEELFKALNSFGEDCTRRLDMAKDLSGYLRVGIEGQLAIINSLKEEFTNEAQQRKANREKV